MKGTCMSPHLHVVIRDYWWWFLTPWSSWESCSSGSLCWKASGSSSLPKATCNCSQVLVWHHVCWDFEKDHPGLSYRTPVLCRISSPAHNALNWHWTQNHEVSPALPCSWGSKSLLPTFPALAALAFCTATCAQMVFASQLLLLL